MFLKLWANFRENMPCDELKLSCCTDTEGSPPLLKWITCGGNVTSHQQEITNPSGRVTLKLSMRTCAPSRESWTLYYVTDLPGWNKRYWSKKCSGEVSQCSLKKNKNPTFRIFLANQHLSVLCGLIQHSSSRKHNESVAKVIAERAGWERLLQDVRHPAASF